MRFATDEGAGVRAARGPGADPAVPFRPAEPAESADDAFVSNGSSRADTGQSGTADPSGYALIDAGRGRRLERFGGIVVDRPAPMVEDREIRNPGAWTDAHARFERPGVSADDGARGTWSRRPGVPETWQIAFSGCTFELRLAAGGQVGLFPEHLGAARWLADHCREPDRGVLNLFAYTGLATLILARRGIPVTHLDASRTATGWARRNAARSHLEAAPVRWIVDDAEAFVRRELRRGHRYGGVLLDPPTYGHGPRGEPWQFDDRIDALLESCGALLVPGGGLLMTTHTPGLSSERLGARLSTIGSTTRVEHGPLELRAESGALLPLGAWARCLVG